MVVTTTRFRMLSEQVAASLEAPDTRLLVVPHPLGGTDEATILAWADGAVVEALRLLGQGPEPAPTGRGAEAGPGDLTRAVAAVRALVAADGGDVELTDADASTIRLRLILETAACRECVMPGRFLEQVALDTMRGHLPELAHVEIDDPREQPPG